MHIHKTSRLAAAIALATALSACGAGGDGSSNNGGNGGNGGNVVTPAEACDDIQGAPNQGVIEALQGAVCDVTDNTALAPVNNIILNLIIGTPLEDLVSQINDLIGPNGDLSQINELLQMLIGGNQDGALTPLLQGLNAVIIGLLAGDPESIADALAGFGGDGGSPLDALLGLGGEDNPLASLLGLGGGGNGGGGSGGLITSVQDVLDSLTGNTALSELANVVDSLLNPQSGGLAPLTGALDDLTNVDGGPLGPLTELVNALLATDDAALAPLVVALNQILVGLLTDQDPAAIADALQGLAGGLGGDNPLAGLLPGGDGGSGGNGDGLITSVQEVVDNLLGGTPLDQLGDAVDMLVDPDEGALEALTSVLEGLTAEELAALTEIVNGLVVGDDSALGGLVTTLNGVLGGLGGGLGGGDIPLIGGLL